MGFFQRLKNGLARFMYGRNGGDQFGMALIWGCLILSIASSFIMRRWQIVGTVIYWASMAVWAYAIFRILSKNLYKRREENSRWLQFWWKLKSGTSGAKTRHADKDHKYFTCKSCKTICRVPVGKGKVVITCPKCGGEIHGKT